MSGTENPRELRMARFVEIYDRWTRRQITQTRAARLLGVSERTFRRYAARYRKAGLQGLRDGRLRSHRRAPSDETARAQAIYSDHYPGWSVRAFFEQYRLVHSGTRSLTWVNGRLQEGGLVPKRGRKARPDRQYGARRPSEGMLLLQRGMAFEWCRGQMSELLLTIDDASSKVHSGFLTRGEPTWSRFRGIHEVLVTKGLFDAIHVDDVLQAPPSAGETPFHRAMRELGITVMPSTPRDTRARCDRVFKVLRTWLPHQLEMAGITTRKGANALLRRNWSRFNAFFAVAEPVAGSRFQQLTPTMVEKLVDVLCMKTDAQVGRRNQVPYRDRVLEIPPREDRVDYRGEAVCVHEYEDGRLAVFRGGDRLGRYNRRGELVDGNNSAP